VLGQIGVPELLIILFVALLIFGPSKLPSLGKSIGEGIVSFKKGLSGQGKDEEKDEENTDRKKD
jgi:sec-independent protein translocase protein TatA